MLLLTDEAIVAACLARYRTATPDAWGFAWLGDTLAALLRSELEARSRTVLLVDVALADTLLRAAVRCLRDPGWQQATRQGVVSPVLHAWWAGWDALEPALRERAIAMPVEWLLALWAEALADPASPPVDDPATPQEVG